MFKVQNNNKGEITVAHDDGRKVVLLPGINENVPDWIGEVDYAEALVKAEIILVVGHIEDSTDATYLPPAEYQLDANGNPIQALDDDGEPVFDEATGYPVYVPKQAE